MEENIRVMKVKDGAGQFVETSDVSKYRSEHHYKMSSSTDELDLNNGHRDNLTSCCTLHVFLRMPCDWFDTCKVTDRNVFRSNIMEWNEEKI